MSVGKTAQALAAAAAVFATLTLPTASAGADSKPDASALLRASIAAPRTVSFVGQLQTIRFSPNRASASIVRIDHLAPDRTRRWFMAPQSLYGDYIITQGITTWEFDTRHARVITSQNPLLDTAVAGIDSMHLVTANYRPILGPRETIAGHSVISLDLINKFSGERTLRVWIDTKTHLVLKKELYHGNGSLASQTRFEELRYTDRIPTDLFTTTVPAGFAKVAGHDYITPSSDVEGLVRDAGFRPVGPRDLPDGFALVSGTISNVGGVRTLHLNYSDGLRTISMFENAKGAGPAFGQLRPHGVKLGATDAQYVEDGSTTLIAWKDHGLSLTLVGGLTQSELLRIAKSVVP